MKAFLFILAIVLLLFVGPSFGTNSVTPPTYGIQYITSAMSQAIDKGMSDVVSSSQWISLFQSLSIPFQVPSCVEKTSSYPSKNPFSSSKTKLNICYEEPTDVWRVFYKQAGDMLVSTLNSRYSNAKLKANHIVINTTMFGYFDTLKRAADSGICDIVTSNVIYSVERAEKIHFNCGYGSSSTAILLSNKAYSLNYTSIQDLLKAPSLSISALKGSFFETASKNTFPNSIVIPKETYEDGFNDVLADRVHGTIADAIDLIYWLNSHKQNCTHCAIKVFGDAYSYGSFVTRYVEDAGNRESFGIMLIIGVLLLFSLIH